MITQYQEAVKLWQSYPVYFIENILGIDTLEDYQKTKILEPIVKYERVAIKACHSVGKTFCMARIVLWFCSCFPNSKIITTAPTFRQVKLLLWSEIRTGYFKSKTPLGGQMNLTDWKIDDDWFSIGFTSEVSAGTESADSTFQGFHAKHILVIFDEATGVAPKVWSMVEGLLTSGYIIRFVCIANPTSRASNFYNCFKLSNWHTESINCFDSPNLKINNINNLQDLNNEIDYINELPDAEKLNRIQSYKTINYNFIRTDWVISKALEWGLDHPLFMSKALGEFPEDDENGMIKFSDIMNAINREYEIKKDDIRLIGVDVARFGSDKTVISEIIGYKQTEPKILVKRDTTEVIGAVINFLEGEHYKRKTRILVDSTGLGSGTLDVLLEKQREGIIPKWIDIVEVQFGAACEKDEDKKDFANLKAHMYYCLSQDVKENLDLLDENNYLNELPLIQYKFDSKGRTIIEKKEDYKKRTGKPSPDFADSLALANFGRHYNMGIGSFKNYGQRDMIKKDRKQRDAFKSISSRIKQKEY